MENVQQVALDEENPGEITSSDQGARNIGERFDGDLWAFNVTTQNPLTGAKIRDLANPNTGLVGVTFPEFVSQEACRKAMAMLNHLPSAQYGGAAADTLSAGLGVPHWIPRYSGIAPHMPDSLEAWMAYFAIVKQWDADRISLFADSFRSDPLELITNVVEIAIGRPVKRAVHPRYGRTMGVGLVREGAPRAHFDYAEYDVGYNTAGHIGIVLVLDAGPGACQRAWNYRPEPDELGNYATFDHTLDPRLTGFLDIPTPVGCLSLLCARYVHEIIDVPGRTTLAAHLAWLPDGDQWILYS